jgi:hypothetical protein
MRGLYVVEFSPIYEKQHTWAVEGERDVQVGTTISFRGVNTDEAVTRLMVAICHRR